MKVNRNVTNLEQDLILDGHVLEEVQNFRYLGALINSKKLVSDEIKSTIASGDRCFYSLRQILRSRAMSNTLKIKMYKMMVKPFESETWL